jgi:hypothetical protein
MTELQRLWSMAMVAQMIGAAVVILALSGCIGRPELN